MNQIFPGVFREGRELLTKNLVPGFRSHSEKTVKHGPDEFRVWDPHHSKPAAALAKGLKTFPLKPGMKVLYLGIANGNTSSFFSDILGPDGVIYGVEISERSLRDLNPVAEKRKNIIPILANAKLPKTYSWIEKVDLVFEDVATSDQSEILIRNCQAFLNPGGFAMLSVKSRSIDVTKPPEAIYRQEIAKLERHFKILEKVRLDPFEKDHMLIVMKMK